MKPVTGYGNKLCCLPVGTRVKVWYYYRTGIGLCDYTQTEGVITHQLGEVTVIDHCTNLIDNYIEDFTVITN